MANCPTLMAISAGDLCEENFAGLGAKAWFFNKKDIDTTKFQTIEGRPNVYQFTKDTLKSSAKLYPVELKTGSQSITGESQGKNKGFKLTGQLIIEVVNEKTAMFLRSLNNLDWGVIVPDGELYQIMYSPNYKVTLDSGALKTETGAQASDDRVATLAPVLENVLYPNLFVEFAADGGDTNDKPTSPESYEATA